MDNAPLYDIVAALASKQPAAAVERIQAELSSRVETAVASVVSGYQYQIAGRSPTDGAE